MKNIKIASQIVFGFLIIIGTVFLCAYINSLIPVLNSDTAWYFRAFAISNILLSLLGMIIGIAAMSQSLNKL